MLKGIKLFQKLQAAKIQRATQQYLAELEKHAPHPQESLSAQLSKLRSTEASNYDFGTTKKSVQVELAKEKVFSHCAIEGASGAGKSFFAVNLVRQILLEKTASLVPSFGALDPKPELVGLICQYLHAHLYRLSPAERKQWHQRIFLLDFANADSISPYNLLARQPSVPDEVLVASRIEMLSEQFSGLSPLTVRMKQTLKPLLLLMMEFGLPLPFFARLCSQPLLLSSLVNRTQNPLLQEYFSCRFAQEGKGTVMALQQRIDALLVSPSVRHSLSAPTAPDFAALQDRGAIMLISTGGRHITRGINELLLSLILSDLKQSVFRRAQPKRKVLWLLDEAQNLFKTTANRENISDLLTQSRSFGTYLGLMTQSLSSAVRDADILNTIFTNIRWLVMLRSTVRDANLISAALPLTGQCTKTPSNPYEPPKRLTESEEVKLRLEEVASFPDREAYFWYKAEFPKAIKIKTPYLPPPHEIAGCTADELARFAEAEPLGQGMTPQAIQHSVDEQLRKLETHRTPRAALVHQKPATKTSRRTLEETLEEEYG